MFKFVKNLFNDFGVLIFWGVLIGFILFDNHFDCNGSDNWTPSKNNG